MGVPVTNFNLLPPRSSQYSPGILASLAIHGLIVIPFVVLGTEPAEKHDPIDQMVVFLVPPQANAGRETQGRGLAWSSVTGTAGAVKEEIKAPTDPPEHTLVLGDAGRPATTS